MMVCDDISYHITGDRRNELVCVKQSGVRNVCVGGRMEGRLQITRALTVLSFRSNSSSIITFSAHRGT